MANSTNGLLVRWEHRFYGESMPEFTNKTGLFEPDNLADYFHYHTVDQALEDVVAFSSMLTYDGQELSPSTTPWVFVGGSYSGARAAWLRERNPEIIFASLASSAVVEITEELPQYREAIFRCVNGPEPPPPPTLVAERLIKCSYFDTTGRKGCMDDVRSLIKNMNDIYTRKNYAAYKKLVTMYAPEGPANRAWNDAWAQYYFSIIVQEIFGTGFEFQVGAPFLLLILLHTHSQAER